MSLNRTLLDRCRWALPGLLLACLAVSCSVPDGLMLNISVPPTVKVKSYVIKVQERSTRKVVFLSGLQQIAAGRDLSVEPLRVAMPFRRLTADAGEAEAFCVASLTFLAEAGADFASYALPTTEAASAEGPNWLFTMSSSAF